MRILIASDTYYPHANGTSYFTQRLAVQLVKKGHDVLVIAPGMGFTDEYYSHDGVPIFGLRSVPLIGLKKDMRISLPILLTQSIEQAMKEFKPDVVHLQDHFFIGKTTFKLCRKLGVPVMATNHFLPENFLHYAPLYNVTSHFFSDMMWNQLKDVYENVDITTTPTQSSANCMKSKGFDKEIYPVSCGIDLKRFSPTKDSKSIKKKYRLPDVPIFLYVGRLDKEKNLDVVLRCFANSLNSAQSHLVLAGKGVEEQRLKELAKERNILNSVTFTGYVTDEDLPKLYCASDCFIMAGTAELQSIVTMEAMASGLPVIAADAIALPELVHNGSNGYLFNIEDEEVFSKYIVALATNADLRKKMSKKSLEIVKPHNIHNSIKTFISYYKKLSK